MSDLTINPILPNVPEDVIGLISRSTIQVFASPGSAETHRGKVSALPFRPYRFGLSRPTLRPSVPEGC